MPEFIDPRNDAPPHIPVPDALARRPRRNERLDLSRQLQLDRELVVAHIFVAEDGGPVRTIINGRHHKPTGRYYMIKTGFRSSPWESMDGEYPFMQLCEVATPVHRFLAQPHRLEMQVVGSARRWVYFPDARIVVDRPFGEMLMEGVPFDRAVADWRPHMADGVTTVILVEVKTDKDTRAEESDYKAKLTLAREVYHRLGWGFIQVRQSDLAMDGIGYSVHEIGLDNDASVDAEDVRVAAEYVGTPGAELGGLIRSLGGRPAGMAKAAALHVRRVVNIGLDNHLRSDTRVRLVGDGKDLFGVMER